MRIEVGKKYINASGAVDCIIGMNNFPKFYEGKIKDYNENGKIDTYEVLPEDLICEVNEDIYTAYKQDLITKKEFLNKHFEIYSGMTIEQYNAKNQDNQKID